MTEKEFYIPVPHRLDDEPIEKIASQIEDSFGKVFLEPEEAADYKLSLDRQEKSCRVVKITIKDVGVFSFEKK